jgi:hypothetical protein
MAGEKTAKFYESLTAIAVKLAVEGTSFAKLQVLREVNIPNISIRSDVVVGEAAIPRLIFLVTHSNIATMWERKFKRDAAELIELAISRHAIEGVFLVIFDNSTLPALLKIAAYSLSGIVSVATFDKKQQIRRMAHDESILALLDKLVEDDRQSKLLDMFAATPENAHLLSEFAKAIKGKITVVLGGSLDAGGYIPLTKINVNKRITHYKHRETRHTRFNRAISKLGFFSPAERESIQQSEVLKGDLEWATCDIFWPIDNKTKGQLLASVGKSGFKCIDPEILGGPLGSKTKPIIAESIFEKLDCEEISRIIAKARQPMTQLYEARIQAREVFESSITFIVENRHELIKKGNLSRLLIKIAEEPSAAFCSICGDVPGSALIRWHWLYTGLVALLKAAKRSKQGFGYSKIASRMPAGRNKRAVEGCVLQNLEYCHKTLPSDLVQEVGESIASFLAELNTLEIQSAQLDAYRYLVLCEVEDKWNSHGFDVLPAMIELASVRHGFDIHKTHMTSCLAIASDAGGTAGRTSVYRSKDTIIWYKASHLRQNVLHKRKELQSTVASWWQTWDPIKEIFVPTKAFKKTILVIDGDWEEEDLKLMHSFGWDEFLYPDELDRLPDLIV